MARKPRPVRPTKRTTKRYYKTNYSGKREGYYDVTISELSFGYETVNSVGWPVLKPQNPCDIRRFDRRVYPKVFKLDGKATDWDVPPFYEPDISNGRVTHDDVVRRAAGKLRDEISMEKMDMLTALAEMRSSVQLVTDTINEADRHIRKYGLPQEKLKRAKFKALPYSKKWRRISRKLAGMQLAFSFGWKPLAADINTLCNGIGLIGNNLKGWVKGKSKESDSEGFSLDGSSYSYEYEFYAAWKALVEMSNPFLATAAELGLTNPAQTAWELVPWSFAIDWLYPVGDFLAQAEAMTGLSLVEASLTTRYAQKGVITGPHGGFSISEKKQLVRTIETGFPYHFPDIENPFTSIPRALNQISLLVQLGIGKGR